MKARFGMDTDVQVKRRPSAQLGTRLHNEWIVTCRDRGGGIQWEASVPHNLVVLEGRNHAISTHMKGAAYTAAWYIGLAGASPEFVAADTMAAHGGWAEMTAYSEAYRQTLTLGSVAGGSAHNHAAPGTFTINAPSVIGGAWLCTDAEVGSANGTLYGGGAFASGNQSVGSGDSLSVRVTTYAGAA